MREEEIIKRDNKGQFEMMVNIAIVIAIIVV